MVDAKNSERRNFGLEVTTSYITGAVDAGPAETERLFNDWVAEVILNEVESCKKSPIIGEEVRPC